MRINIGETALIISSIVLAVLKKGTTILNCEGSSLFVNKIKKWIVCLQSIIRLGFNFYNGGLWKYRIFT